MTRVTHQTEEVAAYVDGKLYVSPFAYKAMALNLKNYTLDMNALETDRYVNEHQEDTEACCDVLTRSKVFNKMLDDVIFNEMLMEEFFTYQSLQLAQETENPDETLVISMIKDCVVKYFQEVDKVLIGESDMFGASNELPSPLLKLSRGILSGLIDTVINKIGMDEKSPIRIEIELQPLK